MTNGFSDLDGDALLTAAEVACRMGRPSWAALRAWLRRADLPPPPRLYGSRRFRARDLQRWAAGLPTDRDHARAGWSGRPPAPRALGVEDPPCERIEGHLPGNAQPGATFSDRGTVVPPDELARRRALAMRR